MDRLGRIPACDMGGIRMTLYEIDSAIMDCVDEETGEIIDLEKLEALNIERDKKWRESRWR